MVSLPCLVLHGLMNGLVWSRSLWPRSMVLALTGGSLMHKGDSWNGNMMLTGIREWCVLACPKVSTQVTFMGPSLAVWSVESPGHNSHLCNSRSGGRRGDADYLVWSIWVT